MLLARLQLGGSGFAQNVRGTKGPAAPQRPASIHPANKEPETHWCMHAYCRQQSRSHSDTHSPRSHSHECCKHSMHALVCAVYWHWQHFLFLYFLLLSVEKLVTAMYSSVYSFLKHNFVWFASNSLYLRTFISRWSTPPPAGRALNCSSKLSFLFR